MLSFFDRIRGRRLAGPGPDEGQRVLRKLFVSHAYEDGDGLERLLAASLPQGAEPVVFPAIEVATDRRVSDVLMKAIRECDGLVHIASQRSAASFWVQYERNYALRLAKPVLAFDPAAGTFHADHGAVVDPIVAVNWNNAVARDCGIVREVAHHLDDLHRFEIRGDKHAHLDNDLRQMLDAIEGLGEKMAAGGVGLLFLSNEGVCGGWHDWADPFTFRQAQKDLEPVPPGYTEARFARLDSGRCLVTWLDKPDERRITRMLDGGLRAKWPSFARVVETGLSGREPLVISDGQSLNWNRVDDIMVRAFALAFTHGDDFRRPRQQGRR